MASADPGKFGTFAAVLGSKFDDVPCSELFAHAAGPRASTPLRESRDQAMDRTDGIFAGLGAFERTTGFATVFASG